MKRREFLMAVPVAAVGLAREAAAAANRGAAAASAEIAETKLVSAAEPGQQLVVSGTIYGPDGVTPARGVRLFLYHTDTQGYYSQPRDNSREARIRGWVPADEQGRYRFRTIQPAHYATGARPPAHIHTHLYGPDMPAHWMDSFLFADDRYLTAEQVSESRKLGEFSPIMQGNARGGVLYCARDIRLNPGVYERNRLVNGWYRN